MTGPPPARGRLLQTTSGTRSEAFGAPEWGLLAVIATIWGSSFMLMEIGLQSFRPALVTLLRVGLGAVALALVPRARRTRIDRQDLPTVALLGVTWMGSRCCCSPSRSSGSTRPSQGWSTEGCH